MIHSGLTALMAQLYIQRHNIPLANTYIFSFKDKSNKLTRHMVADEPWRIFNTDPFHQYEQVFFTATPEEIERYFTGYQDFIAKIDEYTGGQDFVLVANNLDSIFAQNLVSQPNCIKLNLLEEGTISYLEKTIPWGKHDEDLEQNILNFISENPQWEFSNCRIAPLKFIHPQGIKDVFNPNIGRLSSVDCYRLTDFAFNHLVAERNLNSSQGGEVSIGQQDFEQTTETVTAQTNESVTVQTNEPATAQTTKSEKEQSSEPKYLAVDQQVNFYTFSNAEILGIDYQSKLLPLVLKEFAKFIGAEDKAPTALPSWLTHMLHQVDVEANTEGDPETDATLKPEKLEPPVHHAHKNFRFHILLTDNLRNFLYKPEKFIHTYEQILTNIAQQGVKTLYIKGHSDTASVIQEIISYALDRLEYDLELIWIDHSVNMELEYVQYPPHTFVIHSVTSSSQLYAERLGQDNVCYSDYLVEYMEWNWYLRNHDFYMRDFISRAKQIHRNDWLNLEVELDTDQSSEGTIADSESKPGYPASQMLQSSQPSQIQSQTKTGTAEQIIGTASWNSPAKLKLLQRINQYLEQLESLSNLEVLEVDSCSAKRLKQGQETELETESAVISTDAVVDHEPKNFIPAELNSWPKVQQLQYLQQAVYLFQNSHLKNSHRQNSELQNSLWLLGEFYLNRLTRNQWPLVQKLLAEQLENKVTTSQLLESIEQACEHGDKRHVFFLLTNAEIDLILQVYALLKIKPEQVVILTVDPEFVEADARTRGSQYIDISSLKDRMSAIYENFRTEAFVVQYMELNAYLNQITDYRDFELYSVYYGHVLEWAGCLAHHCTEMHALGVPSIIPPENDLGLGFYQNFLNQLWEHYRHLYPHQNHLWLSPKIKNLYCFNSEHTSTYQAKPKRGVYYSFTVE